MIKVKTLIILFCYLILSLVSAQAGNDTYTQLQEIYKFRQIGETSKALNLTEDVFYKIDLVNNPYANVVTNLLIELSSKQGKSNFDLFNEIIRTKRESFNKFEEKDFQKNKSLRIFFAFKNIVDKNYVKAEQIISKLNKEYKSDLFRVLYRKFLTNKDYVSVERVISEMNEVHIKDAFYLLIAQSKLYSYSNAFFTFKNSLVTEKTGNPIWKDIALFYLNAMRPNQLLATIRNHISGDALYNVLCQANFFIGFKYYNGGNQNLANKYFSDAIGYGTPDIIEYNLANDYLNSATAQNEKIDVRKKTIAVLDFDSNGFTIDETKIVSNLITSYLIRRNKFTVIERAKMEEILVEQGFQQSGCVSDECIIEAGHLLGVELMLAGSIGRFGNLNLIDIRIISVSTGKNIASSSYQIEGKKELIISEGLNSALNQLLN